MTIYTIEYFVHKYGNIKTQDGEEIKREIGEFIMRWKNCNAQEFIANLNGRKVICFGAGTSLIERDTVEDDFEHLEEHIAFLVDNNAGKHGQTYQYKNYTYDIRSVETLKQIDARNYVLLITCMYYVEIYEQLKDVAEIMDMECYAYHLICLTPYLDVENYLTREIEKRPYREWKQIFHELQLKDKHKGQRCFVIGNGPSLNERDLECLKDEVTFAANRIYKIFDKTSWRPTYYFCMDYEEYGADHEKINKIQADLRFVPIERAIAAGRIYDEITYYHQKTNETQLKEGRCVINAETKFSYDCEEIVYGGRTVLYDALQMALYMGFSEIYLLGVDCAYRLEMLEDGRIIETNHKDYFSDDYLEALEESSVPTFAMIRSFQKAKEACESKGVSIKNATRGGKLEVFERVDFDTIINFIMNMDDI